MKDYLIDEVLDELRTQYNQLIEWKLSGVQVVRHTDDDTLEPADIGNVIPFPRPLKRTLQ